MGYKLRPILPHSVQLEHVGPVLLCAVSPALSRCAHATSAGEMPHPRTIAGRRRDVTKIQRVSHYVATLAFSAIVRGALKLADVFRIALQHQAPSELQQLATAREERGVRDGGGKRGRSERNGAGRGLGEGFRDLAVGKRLALIILTCRVSGPGEVQGLLVVIPDAP